MAQETYARQDTGQRGQQAESQPGKGGEVARRSDDWLDQWFAAWPRRRFWPELRRMFGESFSPVKVEEFPEGDQAVIRAELPGIDPEKDVDITIDNGRLHLRAERRQERSTEEEGRIRTEFSYGSFSRTLPLPPGATEDDVHASYKDGILEVRIPVRPEQAESKRKIPVRRG